MISKTKIFLFFLQELYLLMHNNKKKEEVKNDSVY